MPDSTDKHQKLISLLKNWQKIEDLAIQNTTEIIKQNDNSLVHIVMEIIRQDSVMHRRVQQIIIDNYEKSEINVNKSELLDFWDLIEEHDNLEKRTIETANELLKETDSPYVKFLLEYLLTDETKHDVLLNNLDKLRGKD